MKNNLTPDFCQREKSNQSHPGLAEIPEPNWSQEVVVHTHKCLLLIG